MTNERLKTIFEGAEATAEEIKAIASAYKSVTGQVLNRKCSDAIKDACAVLLNNTTERKLKRGEVVQYKGVWYGRHNQHELPTKELNRLVEEKPQIFE